MKITDPNVIKNGEKDLIEAVKNDLDLDAIKEVLAKKIADAELSANGGEIVVYNNQIAFRLDFDIQMNGSLMFDRQGNYIIETEISGGSEESDDGDTSLGLASLPSDDLDLEDVNIDGTLEEVGPETDLLAPDDSDDSDDSADELLETVIEEEDPEGILEEDLDIGLPDYDPVDELVSEDEEETEMDGLEELNEDSELDLDLGEDDLIQDDDDDDINDILKESRDFWEKDKD